MTKLLIEVETFDAQTDLIEKTHTIDFANPRDRAWLAKHSMWALHNGKGVTTCPKLSNVEQSKAA
jgi:hypothetical protein